MKTLLSIIKLRINFYAIVEYNSANYSAVLLFSSFVTEHEDTEFDICTTE